MICLKPKLILSMFLVGYTGLVLAADVRQNGSHIVIVPGAGTGAGSQGKAAPGDSPDQRPPIRISRSDGHLSNLRVSRVGLDGDQEVERLDLPAGTVEEKLRFLADELVALKNRFDQQNTRQNKRIAALENKRSCFVKIVKCLCCMK